MAPIKDNLKKMVDCTNNDEKLELKGEVQGEVKKIIERAINADRLFKDIVALEKERVLI